MAEPLGRHAAPPPDCPIAPECESCGRLDELAVLTGDTLAGILCMTLCEDCEVAGVDPIFTRQRPPASSRTVSTWEATATR